MSTNSQTYREIAERIIPVLFEGTSVATPGGRGFENRVADAVRTLPSIDLSGYASMDDDQMLRVVDTIFGTTIAGVGQHWRDRYLPRLRDNGAEWVRLITEAQAADKAASGPVIRGAHPSFPDPIPSPTKVTILPNATACGGNPIINERVKAGVSGYISGNWCDSDGDMYVYIPKADEFDTWTPGVVCEWSGYIFQQFVVPFAGRGEEVADTNVLVAHPAGTKVRIKEGATYANGINMIDRWIGRTVTINAGPDHSGDYSCRFSAEDGGGDMWVHRDFVEVVEAAAEPKQDDVVTEVAPEPEPEPLVATQAQLNEQREAAAEARRKMSSLCRVLNGWLNEKADEQNMCDDYESALDDLNSLIRPYTSYEFEGRTTEVEAEGYIEVELTVRVPWSESFEVTRGTDSHDEANERISEADVDEYSLKEAAQQAIDNGDYNVSDYRIERVS